MPQDNERIIEISAELSQALKLGVIELLKAGAPCDLVSEALHATARLDRAPEMLASGGSNCLGGSVTGLSTAEFMPRTDPAIAELSEKVDRLLQVIGEPREVLSSKSIGEMSSRFDASKTLE